MYLVPGGILSPRGCVLSPGGVLSPREGVYLVPGGCLPRGVYPGGCLSRGCLPRGVSAQGGCLPRGVSAQGRECLPRGGVCSGGCLPSGCLPRGVCPEGGVCHSAGIHPAPPEIQSMRGQYTSYWNAILLAFYLHHKNLNGRAFAAIN